MVTSPVGQSYPGRYSRNSTMVMKELPRPKNKMPTKRRVGMSCFAGSSCFANQVLMRAGTRFLMQAGMSSEKIKMDIHTIEKRSIAVR